MVTPVTRIAGVPDHQHARILLGACRRQQGRGGLSARRSVREAAPAGRGLVTVLREALGQGQERLADQGSGSAEVSGYDAYRWWAYVSSDAQNAWNIL